MDTKLFQNALRSRDFPGTETLAGSILAVNYVPTGDTLSSQVCR